MGPTSQILSSQTADACPDHWEESGQLESGGPAELPQPGTPLNLATCERESIHIPSAIQPDRMLLAVRELDQRVAYVSGNSEAFLKLAPDAVLGRSISDVLGAHSVAAIESAACGEAGIVAARIRITLAHDDSISFHGFVHRFDGILCIELEPYSPEQRWSVPARKTEEAGGWDTLTRLPDRRALIGRLGRCGKGLWTSSACLIFVDIDRFKMVNDTLGHGAGDELLIQVAQRLTSCVGAEHLVARLGGDEFVVFCENLGLDDARSVAAMIVESFQVPFQLQGKPFRCATSIGLAAANSRGLGSIADILHAADSAMHAAKRRGGNQFVVFENPLHDQLMRQVQLEQDLFQAIERGEMAVHFQAQVSVGDHRLIGFESLLRWNHPVHGNISPAEFIPMAEYTGHIQAIGAWVLRDSLRQIGLWRSQANSNLFVAVNVSIQQMTNEDFAELVRDALHEAGLPSEALHLEVTESMLMQSSTEAQLQAIQAIGVRIAIDDFGTGYSSLSYLPRLAVSEVKLDRSFLEGVGIDARKTALFGAIIGMAHTLNLEVVAEGIEDATQLDCVREHLCDSAQGYLLSRPLSAETVERMLLEEWKHGFLSAATNGANL